MPLVVDLVDRIEQLYTEMPDKRKRKEYKEWLDTINLVIEELNKLCKFKMYNKVK